MPALRLAPLVPPKGQRCPGQRGKHPKEERLVEQEEPGGGAAQAVEVEHGLAGLVGHVVSARELQGGRVSNRSHDAITGGPQGHARPGLPVIPHLVDHHAAKGVPQVVCRGLGARAASWKPARPDDSLHAQSRIHTRSASKGGQRCHQPPPHPPTQHPDPPIVAYHRQ